MSKIQIAIDGPAGAGKSTVAREVANVLGYLYIDTGAMYRALTYKAIIKKIDFSCSEDLKELLEQTDIKLTQSEKEQKVFIDNVNITEEIRSSEVTNTVSLVAVHKEVREEMVKRQRILAQDGGVVMDGRDAGTCVLQNAALKVFLQASVMERAKRRFNELKDKGIEVEFGKLKDEIALRDKLDSEREVAPLKKAEDAVEIDSTLLSIDEVVNKIMILVKERT